MYLMLLGFFLQLYLLLARNRCNFSILTRMACVPGVADNSRYQQDQFTEPIIIESRTATQVGTQDLSHRSFGGFTTSETVRLDASSKVSRP